VNRLGMVLATTVTHDKTRKPNGGNRIQPYNEILKELGIQFWRWRSSFSP
jgi:hypothetical protein